MRNVRMTGTAGVRDQIEARGLHGRPSRRAKVVELLGSAGHRHYRVRWDDHHESIVYSSDGVIIIARPTGRGALAEESDQLIAPGRPGIRADRQSRAPVVLRPRPGIGNKPSPVVEMANEVWDSSGWRSALRHVLHRTFMRIVRCCTRSEGHVCDREWCEVISGEGSGA
jgi:hypothetical protein